MNDRDWGKLGVQIALMSVDELQQCSEIFGNKMSPPKADDLEQFKDKNVFVMHLNTPEHFKRHNTEISSEPLEIRRLLALEVGGQEGLYKALMSGIYPENIDPKNIINMLEKHYPDAYAIFQEINDDNISISTDISVVGGDESNKIIIANLSKAWDLYLQKIIIR